MDSVEWDPIMEWLTITLKCLSQSQRILKWPASPLRVALISVVEDLTLLVVVAILIIIVVITTEARNSSIPALDLPRLSRDLLPLMLHLPMPLAIITLSTSTTTRCIMVIMLPIHSSEDIMEDIIIILTPLTMLLPSTRLLILITSIIIINSTPLIIINSITSRSLNITLRPTLEFSLHASG